MERPAHLPVSLFNRQLSPSFIEVLQLNTVSLLRPTLIFVERFELSLDSLVHIASLYEALT